MKKAALCAAAAAAFAVAMPLAAQDVSYTPGTYWEISMIDVEDGKEEEYMDYLAAQYKRSQDFAKSKGYIKDYRILANNNRRAGEPDLYLVTIFDRMTTPAEDQAREKEMNAYMAQTSRQADSNSGSRAKYRKLGGNMLLQEMVYRK